MAEGPYPDYDVLEKRGTPSWNEKTRMVVDHRLALAEDESVLTPRQLQTLRHLVSRIAAQPEGRAPANTAAMVLQKIASDAGDGFRPPDLPRVAECWRRGLDALEAEAQARHAVSFAELAGGAADDLLEAVRTGDVRAAAWDDLPPTKFWSYRLLPDIVSAHWAHPSLWSHMGFGGPASPRGYVRLSANRRDGWEAKERGGD